VIPSSYDKDAVGSDERRSHESARFFDETHCEAIVVPNRFTAKDLEHKPFAAKDLSDLLIDETSRNDGKPQAPASPRTPI
jgi:hypothetical protein